MILPNIRVFYTSTKAMKYGFNSSLHPVIDGYFTDSEAVVMFGSGLNDVNCKEIFRDDIISIFSEELEINIIARVEFKKGMFCYFKDSEYIPLYMTLDICEVIGNIHQNNKLIST